MKGVGVAARTATRKNTRKTAARQPLKKTAATPSPRRPGPTEAVPPSSEVREEADARLADMRDRAADLMDRAADTLDSARQAAADEVSALLRVAEDRARTIRQAAAADARKVLVEVAEEAGTRLRQAEGEADTIRTAAGAEAETILDEARAAAESEAAEILRQAEEQVQEVLAEVEDRACELAAMRRAAAEAAYRTALDDAAQIRGAAQEQANRAAAALAAAEDEMDLVRRRALLELDEQLAQRRAALEEQLAAYREEAEKARAEVEQECTELGRQHTLARQARIDELHQELESLRTKALGEAKSITDRAAKDAQAVKAAAERDASGVISRATQDKARAEEYLAKAQAAAQRTSQRRDFSQKVWKSAPWVALAAGVGLAASGEFALAKLVGFDELVAPLFPLSVDIYAIVAFKKKKDVGPALSIMAASNLAYHLAERAGVHDPSNAEGPQIILGLTTLVVLTFVIIIWRVHRLLDGAHRGGEATPAAPVRTGRPDADRNERTASRTGDAGTARTPGRTSADRTARTADRTEPPRTDRTAGRTDEDRTDRTAKDRTGRTAARTAKGRTANSTPPRTDAECNEILLGLPRSTDGHVTVNAARTATGCNRDRAVRLLSEAGLLSPADAAKHLTSR
jgi:F0F1-type ATP synthase membrane subunit b/b'